MAKLKTNRLFQLMTLLVVCSTSAFLGSTSRSETKNSTRVSVVLAPQQSDEKVIELKTFPTEPYQFDDLSVKKTKIVAGQRFNIRTVAEQAGAQTENWIEGLEFNFKNKTEKEVKYIRLEFDFPETKTGTPMLVYQTVFGVIPNSKENVKKAHQPFSLESDASFKYMLTERELQNIKKFLSSRSFQLESMNSIVIRVEDIFYEDGTRWWQGSWFKPNPNQPSGYEKIN